MKSKPEYRHIFSSPRMFFRALHTISTQKYRLPVRRYILDLFTVELDADVVRQLTESAVALQIPLVPLPVEEAEGEGEKPSPPAPPLRPLTSLRWPYVPEESAYPDPLKRDDPKALQLPQYEAIGVSFTL